MASDRPDLPDRIGIDAHGYGWRAWDDSDLWSMVPQNPDNEPVPEPVTWYVPEDAARAEAARYREALEQIIEESTGVPPPYCRWCFRDDLTQPGRHLVTCPVSRARAALAHQEETNG